MEVRTFLYRIDASMLEELSERLTMDHHGTHKTPLVRRWVVGHPRFHLHFKSTGAIWLDLVGPCPQFA